ELVLPARVVPAGATDAHRGVQKPSVWNSPAAIPLRPCAATGTGESYSVSVGTPLPSSPKVAAPDPRARPFAPMARLSVSAARTASASAPPAHTATAPPRTGTGESAFVVVPLPTWPQSLPPQAQTVPSAPSA